MNFEHFEQKIKRNPISSSVLAVLFVCSTIFSISDTWERLLNIITNFIGYKKPIVVTVDGDGAIEKRLNLAKLQVAKYKIPSSDVAVIKFLTLPMLNNYDDYSLASKQDTSLAIVTTVSPIKTTSDDKVFDGGDCRFGVKASSFERKTMTAVFEIISLSCTDNKGYAYSIESDHPMGYVSELANLGISQIKIINNDGYLTIDVETNYYAQLYAPLKNIQKHGISGVGRF